MSSKASVDLACKGKYNGKASKEEKRHALEQHGTNASYYATHKELDKELKKQGINCKVDTKEHTKTMREYVTKNKEATITEMTEALKRLGVKSSYSNKEEYKDACKQAKIKFVKE